VSLLNSLVQHNDIGSRVARFLPVKAICDLALANEDGKKIAESGGYGQVFGNLHKKDFEVELEEAKRVGVSRVMAGTPRFNSLVTTGVRIKWVVTAAPVALWAVPMKVEDHRKPGKEHEIKHSVASMNTDCLTGGIAIYKKEKEEEVGRVIINHHTGHYQVGKLGLAAFGAPAWTKAGYRPIILTFHEITKEGETSCIFNEEEYQDMPVGGLVKVKEKF
jgi:hypothetical protein